MLVFDPQDPFPLAPAATYAEEKAHATLVDAHLDLRVAETEALILDPGDGAERWLHVPPATFLTPYTELRRILAVTRPAPGALVLDLGAGYGRLGFVVDRHTEARFLGLELVPERVAAGSRALAAFGATRAELRAADLASEDFTLPAADLYFLYDYGTRAAIHRTLDALRDLARRRLISVVGRGRAVRDAIEREHPWLSGVVAPAHHGNFSVYKSAEA